MWEEPVPFHSTRIRDVWLSFKGHPYLQFTLGTLNTLDLVAQGIRDTRVVLEGKGDGGWGRSRELPGGSFSGQE